MGRRASRRREHALGRIVRVESTEMSIWVPASTPSALQECPHSGSSLVLRGTGDEPIGDVRGFSVSLYVRDAERQRCVGPDDLGAIVQVRPSFQAVLWIPARAFDQAWTLASSGLLKQCHIAFTPPKRGTARVVSVTFSNEDDWDDGSAGAPQGPVGNS